MINGQMRALVLGRGSPGSWRIRGEQLGREIGATVSNAPLVIFQNFDLVIVVKRPRDETLRRLHDAKARIVWDVVDAWPQPIGNSWSREECLTWLRGEVARIKPCAIVAATEKMAADCEEFAVPVLTLHHHARPGLVRNPLRDDVRCLGYEGGLQYLGFWQRALDVECQRRGWKLVLNPERLADLDIVVGLRAATGYAARNWKSNVKLANAQGSGTPCVMGREAGYLETGKLGVAWADSLDELRMNLDALTYWHVRKAAADNLYDARPELANIAARYRRWLEELA